MTDAPERIWLYPYDDEDGQLYELMSEHTRSETDLPYIAVTALSSAPEVQELIRAAVKAERERIATGFAETVGVIDAGSPSCVSTACDLFNELETGWTLATIEDEHGNEQYSADNKRVLVSAIRAGKE